jgi:integrase
MQRDFARQRRATDARIDDLLLRLRYDTVETTDTLDEYLQRWLENRRSLLKASTYAGYRRQWAYYISPYLGEVPLTGLTVQVVAAWISTLLTAGSRSGGSLSAATVRYARCVLHKALEDAVTEGLLLVNPASRIPAPHKDFDGHRRRYPASTWTIEELRLFLQHTDRSPLGSLFVLLATTGLRRGEALALSWPNVDLARREIAVRHAITVDAGQVSRGAPKHGRTRRIAIGERALDALLDEQDTQASARARAGRGWDNPVGYVFTDATGEVIRPGRATDVFRRLIPTLPVRRVRLHDLRHSHAVLPLRRACPWSMSATGSATPTRPSPWSCTRTRSSTAARPRLRRNLRRAPRRPVAARRPHQLPRVRRTFGVTDVKANTMIRAFIHEALQGALEPGSGDETRVPQAPARTLLLAAADHLGLDESELDHAAWLYQRSARRNFRGSD